MTPLTTGTITWEDEILKASVAKMDATSSAKVWISISTYKPSELTKAISAKQFEHEPTEANGWERIGPNTVIR